MEPSKFVLKVTAGHSYDSQREIQVNTLEAHTISSPHIDARLHVRIKDFRGLPKSPPSSPYFAHPSRSYSLYSLQFSFTLPTDTNSDALVFGNDFDHPIRDRLPPMFGAAFKYVKSWIDPGLYGDPYADEPFLYGPALSSVNTFCVGRKEDLDAEGPRSKTPSENSGEEQRQMNGKFEKKVWGEAEDWEDDNDDDDEEEEEEEYDILTEGADDDEAERIREEHGIPATGPQRQKHFLNEDNRRAFSFEQGRVYKCDFFNGYLDFNDFSLKLPLGLSINVVKHWDGQPLRTHTLRYVLRNRETGTLLFVVSFTLVPVDAEGKRQMEEQTGVSLEAVDEVEVDKNALAKEKREGGEYGEKEWDVD